jgi:hypothetical protein
MSVTIDTYNPAQDKSDIDNYNAYLGSLSGEGDWEGGVTMWMLMYMMSMMCQFDSDTIGQDAYIDSDINEIKNLTNTLNNDLNAGRSKEQDSEGNYICKIDGKTYYCDASAKVDGKQVDQKDTLAYKMQQDCDEIKSRTANNKYFQDNPELEADIDSQLDDYMSQIDMNGGNIHQMWQQTDPQYYDSSSTQLGDASIMQPLTDDLQSVQKQFENGDSVMQSIIKSLTSLVETEQSVMKNFDSSLSTMEGTMNSHMSQGT